MQRLTLGILGVAILSLVACSPGDDPPETYATVADLKEAFVSAGGVCDPWEEGETVGPWAQYGNCGEYGDPAEALLSIYTSPEDLQSSIDGVKATSSQGGHVLSQMLVGPNWIVQADDVSSVISDLGGTVVKVG